MEKNNPWLALSTYEEEDKDKFKGREQDTQNMLTMLLQNEYVVCYAASGDGKSSLINAGVCPEMRKVGYYPIKIVFSTDEYEGINIPQNENGKIDFDTCILKKIEEAISQVNRRSKESENQIEFKVDEQFVSFPAYLSTNLWWKLRTQIIQAQVGYGKFDYIPVLIFDQFEEILRARWKNEFFEWLETLSSDECPDAIYSSVSDYEKLPSRKNFKAIFSMRYEYVGELDYWTSQRYFIPQMMRGRYFLKPFTIEQAELIIKAHQSDDVASQQLSINANNIASNLADTDNNVSAIMLSLLSYILYEQWSLNKDYEFTPQNVARLMFTHYENILSRCKISDKERNALESALISSNGARRRMPLSDERLSIFAGDAGNSKIEDLVKEHILRQNDDYIEIVHDRLVEAIYEGNKKRKEEELIQRKKRTRSRIVYGLLFCAILGLIGWVIYYQLVRIRYVEHIVGYYSQADHDKTLICKHDTLYIESNSTIEQSCFQGNYSVRNIVVKGDNVTIEKSAFSWCDNLVSLRIVANNCYIEEGALDCTNKLREIIVEGKNNHIEVPGDADKVYLSVKGDGNSICVSDSYFLRDTVFCVFDVEGKYDSLIISDTMYIGYLRLANAEHFYCDIRYDTSDELTLCEIKIDDLDILKGTFFDTSSTMPVLLNTKRLFLEDDSMFDRLDNTTLLSLGISLKIFEEIYKVSSSDSHIIIFDKEVFKAKDSDEQVDLQKDNTKCAISVSVDEFWKASTEEKKEICKNARFFHGNSDDCWAYGNVIYESDTMYIAALAEVIKYVRSPYACYVKSETKDVYVLDPVHTYCLYCESRTTRVHVPYGYGDYCRCNSVRFQNCSIEEMSVFETIYEKLSYLAIRNYCEFPVQFDYFILFVIVVICRIVYDAKWKKNEKQAWRFALILLSVILIGALTNFAVPMFGNPDIWDIILAIGPWLLVLGIIIWLVYERKRAKKYAIIFGSEDTKRTSFSIVDKIYKEGGKEKDVFLVSNYKKDWDFEKHRWTKNTIVLLTKEELLEKDSEYVKFLSHLKTTGYIRPIVLGVASNQDIVWPRELRKFGRRYNPSVFKAIAVLSKDLRENDLDEVYKFINKKKKMDQFTIALSSMIICFVCSMIAFMGIFVL